MIIKIHHRTTDFDSYRAARVKSLFNVDSGADTFIEADLPISDRDWSIGVIVGGSGTGKTSLGSKIWPEVSLYSPLWPLDQPIIDAISPDAPFDKVAAALSSVGLGSVPAWLRPFHVLSNGEQFRANLARALCDAPDKLVIDEFSSVVDRQIACVGAHAFAKGWRKTSGQAVLLTCHYDVLDWIAPDWIFDTATGQFSRGCLRRRPVVELAIYETNWSYWPIFEKHHYLKLANMIASTCYTAFVDGQPVAHVAYSPRAGCIEARAARIVVMPEWQGLGIAVRLVEYVAGLWLVGDNKFNRPMTTLVNTSHPGLAATLRNRPGWTQISASLYGSNGVRSYESMKRSEAGKGKGKFGGHFRSTQGFRFFGS